MKESFGTVGMQRSRANEIAKGHKKKSVRATVSSKSIGLLVLTLSLPMVWGQEQPQLNYPWLAECPGSKEICVKTRLNDKGNYILIPMPAEPIFVTLQDGTNVQPTEREISVAIRDLARQMGVTPGDQGYEEQFKEILTKRVELRIKESAELTPVPEVPIAVPQNEQSQRDSNDAVSKKDIQPESEIPSAADSNKNQSSMETDDTVEEKSAPAETASSDESLATEDMTDPIVPDNPMEDNVNPDQAIKTAEEQKSKTTEQDAEDPPPPQPKAAVSQVINGEIYASNQSYFLDNGHHIRDAAVNRLSGEIMQDQLGAWGQSYGSWGKYPGKEQVGQLNYHQYGILVGTDRNVNGWKVGVLGGYGQSKLNINTQHSRSNIDSYHLGFYAGTSIDSWNIRLGSTYAWHKAQVRRDRELNGERLINSSDYRGQTMQAFGEVGYVINAGSVSIEPSVNVAYVHAKSQGFQENGDSATALHGTSIKNHAIFSTAGIRATKNLTLGQTEVALQGNLGWRHAYGDLHPSAHLAFTGEASSPIRGALIARNMATFGLGAHLKVAKSTTLELNYACLMNKAKKENSVQLNVVWKF